MILDISDLGDLMKMLRPVRARWKNLGRALKLYPSQLEVIEQNNKAPNDCLIETLILWLNEEYDTKRFGRPSFMLLAEAVRHPAGGNDQALAEMITKKYTHGKGMFHACSVFTSTYELFMLKV